MGGVGELEIARVDGPAHNGETILDSRYSDGSWDTLCVWGENALSVIGYASTPMTLTRRDGEPVAPYQVQGGTYLIKRNSVNDFTMVVGGGP